MSVLAWAKVRIQKRKNRSTFGGSRNRHDGRDEYVIKVPGFSGELRKYMTEDEAREWVEKSNKAAFMSAAEASKRGLFGVEEFTKNGSGQSGFRSVMIKAAARGFGAKKSED